MTAGLPLDLDDDMSRVFTIPVPVIFMEQGSVVIFLNGPNDRLEFLMDGVFGRTTNKFEGIHSVPINSGVHFISYRVNSGSEGAFISLFFDPKEPKVFVFEWSKEIELFQLKCETEIVLDKLLEYPGLISYERFMSQEPGASTTWRRFTSFITGDSLISVLSESKITNELFEVTPMLESHHSLLKELEGFDKNLPKLNFIQIPSLKAYGKLIGTDSSMKLTQCALDKSPIFHYLDCSFQDLFGQLQLSFLLLTFAQNFEGFEQWIDIVTLLLESIDLAAKRTEEFRTFLGIVNGQLEMCPADFFASGLINENRLYKLLNSFFKLTSGQYAAEFKQFYEMKFGWEFDDEEDDAEDVPVIVDEGTLL